MVVLLAALGCWISFQLIRQNGRVLARLEALDQRLAPVAAPPAPAPQPAPAVPAPAAPTGLSLGSPAPEFELPDLHGRRYKPADFRGRSLLLLFFNPGCGFCTRMAPDLVGLRGDGREGGPLPLVVTTDRAEMNRKAVGVVSTCRATIKTAAPVATTARARTQSSCKTTAAAAVRMWISTPTATTAAVVVTSAPTWPS